MSMGTALKMGDEEESEPKITLPLIGLIFFALGPLPQAVKVAGMKGTPATTTFGIIYITSYLLRAWEMFLISRKRYRQGEWSTGLHSTTTTAPKVPPWVRKRLRSTARVLYFFVYVLQGFLWFWVFTAWNFLQYHDGIIVVGRSLSSFLYLIGIFVAFAGVGYPGWYIGLRLGKSLLRKFPEKMSRSKFKMAIQSCTIYFPALLCGIVSTTIIFLTLSAFLDPPFAEKGYRSGIPGSVVAAQGVVPTDSVFRWDSFHRLLLLDTIVLRNDLSL